VLSLTKYYAHSNPQYDKCDHDASAEFLEEISQAIHIGFIIAIAEVIKVLPYQASSQ
jgi:hypothetical protein